MSSSLNLQATLSWCLPFGKFYPQTVGASLEPAVSNANIILQTMLGPPFSWRFNRGSVNFAITNGGGQDYVQTLTDFGFIEKAYVIDGITAAFEMEVKNVWAKVNETGRPNHVCALTDDNANHITFRHGLIPDKGYNSEILYQKKAVLMTSLASSWSPVPDEFAYIYNWGFLSLSAIMANDPRFPIFNQRFISNLLGAQEGLDEMQKNIFVGNWTELLKTLERVQAKVAQGIGVRAK